MRDQRSRSEQEVGLMPSVRRVAFLAVVALAVAALGVLGLWSSAGATNPEVPFRLDPSSAQLAACMPRASLKVEVEFTTDQVGFDTFEIKARKLPPKRSFTVFLLETAAAPFGAAEYIGDFTTNRNGNALNEFRLIVAEAFSSQIVNGMRQRVDLNRIGVWFADPKDDDFCLGPGGGAVTPFDGDNEAGVQAFNSRNADPLPAP
jgi:hypothetical protein